MNVHLANGGRADVAIRVCVWLQLFCANNLPLQAIAQGGTAEELPRQ
jgi:hypothetical protein